MREKLNKMIISTKFQNLLGKGISKFRFKSKKVKGKTD